MRKIRIMAIRLTVPGRPDFGIPRGGRPRALCTAAEPADGIGLVGNQGAVMTSVRQTLNKALEHHGAGRWAEAERLCRLVLEKHPAQGDAWHLLGLQAHQGGRSDLA